jgi:hypothetical protein
MGGGEMAGLLPGGEELFDDGGEGDGGGGGAALTVMEMAEATPIPIALIGVMVYAAAACTVVGVPEMMQLELSVRPAGMVGEMLQLVRAEPPMQVKVFEVTAVPAWYTTVALEKVHK